MKKSVCLALCGVITALCVMLMFLTGLIPTGTYALPGLAGALLIIVVIEAGAPWAWSVFAASSVLSVLVAPDREAALVYVLFLGYYPILKSRIESRKWGAFPTYLIKFSVFNIAAVSECFLSLWLINAARDDFTLFGVSLPGVLLILGNLVFALYDYALSGIAVLYVTRFHRLVARWLHLK